MEPRENEEDDAWEIFNDDGFVHKRRKRRTVDPSPSPRYEAEEDERRRNVRLKIKSEYMIEIRYWELLSKNVRAMDDEARQQGEATTSFCVENVSRDTERYSGSLLDELQTQVEAQQAIIREISHLCDTADVMCNVQEEACNKSLFNLPIWDSPRRLMKSLCNDDVS